MKKNKSYLPVFILGIVAVAAVVIFLSWHETVHEEEEATYQVTKPWRQTITSSDEYVAQIRAIQHIEFRSFEKGYLQNIYVNEGQHVNEGQKMFQLMPKLLEAEFDQANAEYTLAKIEYNNTRSLNKHHVVSANELALAKARLEKAEAVKNLAKTHLDFSTIKAPFDGIMDRFHVRLGSLVEEGELLTTLSDTSKMWVYFNVSESDYLDFMAHRKEGQKIPVTLRLANGKIFDQKGYIDTIEAEFNNETGNVAFRATFPNPAGLLRHGQTGTVLLTKQLENALVIPQKATFEVLDKKYVYVVDAEHVLHSREITVAEEVPHLFAVASGLDEGDTILLEGLGKVHDGQEIEEAPQTREQVQKGLDLPVE